jgi:light-regulated signal transduction histidine kinase (bacteriophytochrome)
MLLQYIREKNSATIFSAQNLLNGHLNVSYTLESVTIAGILIFPLSLPSSDFLVFFRKGQTQEVKCVGNPHQRNFLIEDI